MQINEIFHSIQGESSYAGLPCVFIRLTGCNLRCHYCDTTYSHEEKTEKSIPEIITEIATFLPTKLVEITGGEPLLQEEVYSLFEELQKRNYRILLETNGSISLKKVPEYVIKIVDVKTPGSGFGTSFCLENLLLVDPQKDEIKFVLTDREDYEWAKNFIESNKLHNYKILFSAVRNTLPVQSLAEWILEDNLPVRLQLQLHKYIWDENQRGV